MIGEVRRLEIGGRDMVDVCSRKGVVAQDWKASLPQVSARTNRKERVTCPLVWALG